MKNAFIITLFLLVTSLLGGCSPQEGHFSPMLTFSSPSASSQTNPISSLTSTAFWQNNPSVIWGKLSKTPLRTLAAYDTHPINAEASHWVQLAIISKRYTRDTPQLIQALMAWRNENPAHPGNELFPSNNDMNRILLSSRPKHVAILLPLQGPLAQSGQAVRDGFLSAYYESSKKGPTQLINFYDTTQRPNVNATYQEALAKGADMVIGPLTKEEVQSLTHQGQFPVPTLALNYTTIWFGSLPTNLYQFGLSPLDEAKQGADKAIQAGHSRALIIAEQNNRNEQLVKTFSSRWSSQQGTISDVLYVTHETDLAQAIPSLLHINPVEDRDKMKKENTKETLVEQRRQDFDVIFLFASSNTARTIVPLLRYYYVGKTPIYSTSSIYTGVPFPQKDVDLNGVLFSDIPWVLKKGHALTTASHRAESNRLYAVGRDAYLLSEQLQRLIHLPHFPIYAETGALTLTSEHQIYRRLPWAKMHNGHP